MNNNNLDDEDKVYNYMENQENNPQDDQKHEEEDPNEQEIMKIYELVDSIPLSRPKKNITRDFADGVLVAEIIKFFIPKFVELHNYITTNNLKSKKENWGTLNRKVFKRLGFKLTNTDIDQIINFSPGYIEMILQKVFNKLYENGVDVQEALNKANSGSGGVLEQGINPLNDQNNQNQNFQNYNKGGLYNSKYNNIEEEFKQELIERDKIIEELKIALEETEKNLKISEDNKKILNHQLEVLKNKVRELGLY